MPTIFDIAAEFQALDELLFEAGGDISDPAVAEYVDQLFSEFSSDRDKKMDGYCRLIREAEERSKSRKAESERLAHRAQVDATMVKGLKQALQLFFDDRGIDKVETDRFRVSVGNNGGKLPLHVEDDQVPEGFLIRSEVVEVNKDAIRARLEIGEDLPFARLGDRGRRINIR